MTAKGHGVRRQIPDGMFTRTQIAERVGVSVNTVRRWHDTGVYRPDHSKDFGSIKVWLYTESDIAPMKNIRDTLRPGRRPGHANGAVR